MFKIKIVKYMIKLKLYLFRKINNNKYIINKFKAYPTKYPFYKPN